ncbi:MAG: hypothetical protein SF066_14275 [Thermoanaerobaculia bacterium]|nr:hypothetical protein [Thermoanaerobaculia bacterium]
MSYQDAIISWEPVGSVAPTELRAARLEAHWAARLVGAVGEAAARDPLADYGHIALTFAPNGWAMGAVTRDGVRVGVELEALALGVFGEAGEPRARLELAGLTLDEARQELGRLLGTAAPEPSREEIEDHPLATGGRFGASSTAAAAELGRWFRNGQRFVAAVAAQHLGASPVRLWPHHLDIATLISLDPPGTPEPRSIGFGLSPGDPAYAEPYFYTSPWPVTADDDLAPLAGGGHWHREGFVSAILPASALGGEAGAQVATYLESALAACRKFLAGYGQATVR